MKLGGRWAQWGRERGRLSVLVVVGPGGWISLGELVDGWHGMREEIDPLAESR